MATRVDINEYGRYGNTNECKFRPGISVGGIECTKCVDFSSYAIGSRAVWCNFHVNNHQVATKEDRVNTNDLIEVTCFCMPDGCVYWAKKDNPKAVTFFNRWKKLNREFIDTSCVGFLGNVVMPRFYFDKIPSEHRIEVIDE
jgi:hypothetical protein